MKKILSIIVIAVFIAQAVTVNVRAMPAPLQVDPPVVDILEGPTVEIINASAPGDILLTDAYAEGDGTSVVTVNGTATTRCREEGDLDTTTAFCASAVLGVRVQNNNGEHLTLNACGVIIQEGQPHTTEGRFHIDAGGFGVYEFLPFAKCVQYSFDDGFSYIISLDALWSTGTPLGVEGAPYSWHYTLVLSFEPIETCDDDPTTLASDGYEIDPVIEFPLGPSGSPADDQIYPTVIDDVYRIETDGEWDDGAETRKDAAISWDGIAWLPWSEIEAECVGSTADGGTAYYIVAESETFYIRANDTTGAFADNTASSPYTYTIELTFLSGSCESQYDYDTGEDLLASVTVDGDDEGGVTASDDLVVGEWYAIVVTSGAWQDDGSPPDRTDMELRVDGSAQYNEDPVYHDLSAGGTGVGCQSTDQTTWYIQAQNTTLHLRVNNESGTFGANTGSLSVSIYSAAYERAEELCEVNFDLSGLEESETVSANAENGKVFGSWSGPGSSSGIGTASGGTLIPGAWYVVDTTDGPWAQSGSGLIGVAHPATAFYTMAVSEDGDTWIPLEDWTVPDCNIEIDALGHRRIYFEAPSDEGFTWYFRVDDDDSFNTNAGELGWNLYRASNSEDAPGGTLDDPWESCGDVYEHRLLYNAGTSIPVQEEEGTYLRQVLLGIAGSSEDQFPTDASGSMSIGDIFKLTIKNGPWLDGEDEHYDAAISSDDGVTWYALNDESNPALDCISVDQSGRYYSVLFTVAAEQRWKVRVNDEAGDFVGNEGNLTYVMYKMTNNDASDLGNAGSSDAGNLGVAAGGLAVCIQSLMYPQWTTLTGVFTQPDRPEGLDVWEWVEWVGDSSYQTFSFFIDQLKQVVNNGFQYVFSWINYAVLATQKFFAFCPDDAGILITAMSVLKNKEPIATVLEVITLVTDTRDMLEEYDWGDYEDTSLFSLTSTSQVQAMINSYILRQDAEVTNPWSGSNNVIDFGDSGLPDSYYSCGNAFTDYLPARLADAVCFVTAYFKETGATFWVQLLVVDIGAISITLMSTKRAMQELIYMMTGVRPWTKSGLNSSVDKLASYMEKRDRELDIEAELDRRFGKDRAVRFDRYNK
jgi:hypothetical protein